MDGNSEVIQQDIVNLAPDIINPEIGAGVECITPELAQEWLDTTNINNRPITASRVETYTRAMKNGWKINGEPIIFDRLGRLANGQHRLRACVKAGVPFHSVVVRGTDPETWTTLDTGRNRQASDILGALGVKNYHRTAGAIQWVVRIRSDKVSTAGFWQRSRLAHDDVKDFCLRNQSIYESVTAIRKSTHLAPGTLLAAIHFLLAERDRALADVFFTDLGTGEGLFEGDPVHSVREEFIKAKGKKKIPQFEVAAKLIRAWNLRRQGVRNTRYVKGTVEGAFPQIS